MSIPYTYLLICPTGERYYGVRYAENCNPDDFWVTYFTSSKEVSSLLRLYPASSFQFEIRKTFPNSIQAREWESKVLRRLKVRSNPLWLNKTDNVSIPPMLGDDNPSKRADVRNKIAQKKTGRARPDCAKRMRENHPLKNPESVRKLSETRKAMFASGELIQPKGYLRPDISGEKHFRFGKTYKPLADMNSQEHTCPHCSKVGKGPGMKRYHFDNCKLNRQTQSPM